MASRPPPWQLGWLKSWMETLCGSKALSWAVSSVSILNYSQGKAAEMALKGTETWPTVAWALKGKFVKVRKQVGQEVPESGKLQKFSICLTRQQAPRPLFHPLCIEFRVSSPIRIQTRNLPTLGTPPLCRPIQSRKSLINLLSCCFDFCYNPEQILRLRASRAAC